MGVWTLELEEKELREQAQFAALQQAYWIIK